MRNGADGNRSPQGALVGASRFERPTSCSQGTRSNQAELRPDAGGSIAARERRAGAGSIDPFVACAHVDSGPRRMVEPSDQLVARPAAWSIARR